MQGYSVDETAHQRLAAGPQQSGPTRKSRRQGKRVALAREQMARRKIGPPRNLVDPAQYPSTSPSAFENGRVRPWRTRPRFSNSFVHRADRISASSLGKVMKCSRLPLQPQMFGDQ